MAANKFFTWTKGDKRNAEALGSGGVVPIPIECIAIKGLDYDRNAKVTTKNGRKRPLLSLSFDRENDNKNGFSDRTTESLALQEAAVQSATSLMAVVNELLRSPQISSYMSSNGLLKPTHGRMRSNTAPTTPMVEAPVPSPIELMGSVPPPTIRSYSEPNQYYEDRSVRSATFASSSTVLERRCDRAPNSTPVSADGTAPAWPRRSEEGTRSNPNLRRSYDSAPRSQSCQPFERRPYYSRSSTTEDFTNGTDRGMEAEMMRRRASEAPTPNRTPIPQARSASRETFQTQARSASRETFHRRSVQESTQPPADQQHDVETVLLNEITNMRTTHEAHIVSLKEAHERELESMRTYMSFLEKRREIPATTAPSTRKYLTIDTSQIPSKIAAPLTAEASATTSTQSFETALESIRPGPIDAISEAEALRRKLSLARRAQADFGDIRRERDILRETTENDQRRLAQLKDIVRRAKENDKSLRSAISDLESRLELANVSRVDALEGLHEADKKIMRLTEREDELLRDREELCTRLFYSDPSWDGVVLGKKAPQVDGLNPAFSASRLREEIDALRLEVAEKEARIHDLEHKATVHNRIDRGTQCDGNVSQPHSSGRRTPSPDFLALDKELQRYKTKLSTAEDDLSASRARIVSLEDELKSRENRLSTAESDRDKYNTLLHTELRRQARHASKTSTSFAPQITDKAAVLTTELMATVQSESNGDADITLLQQELQHCMAEIIMYKLDIRGYKKDIKKANLEIDALRTISAQRPPTPESGESLGTSRRREGKHRRPATVDGLGISLGKQPRTPNRPPTSNTAASSHIYSLSVPAAMPAPLCPRPPVSPTSTLQTLTTAAALRPRSPLVTHKQLPLPPGSRSPSPQSPVHLNCEKLITRALSPLQFTHHVVSPVSPISPNNSSRPPRHTRTSAPPAPRTPVSMPSPTARELKEFALAVAASPSTAVRREGRRRTASVM